MAGNAPSKAELAQQNAAEALQQTQSQLNRLAGELAGLEQQYQHHQQRADTAQAQLQQALVASEFEDGSCAHRHILAHEMRHVQVNQLTLSAAAERMREGMRQSFGNKIYYGEPKELQERLTRHIREQWLPWVDAQMKHTLQRHREIDTPEEYARNRKVCGGEIARTLDAMR